MSEKFQYYQTGGATQAERGQAAEAREKYKLSTDDRQKMNSIVHETHDRPTGVKVDWDKVQQSKTKPTFNK